MRFEQFEKNGAGYLQLIKNWSLDNVNEISLVCAEDFECFVFYDPEKSKFHNYSKLKICSNCRP